MKNTLATLALVLTATTATAEVNYNPNNKQHQADVTCIAALSWGRDTFTQADAHRAITMVQNEYILKYAYSKHLNRDTELRKMLLILDGADTALATLKTCANNL